MIKLRNIAGLSCVLATLYATPTRAEDLGIAGRLQLQAQFGVASAGINTETDEPVAVHAGLGCCSVVGSLPLLPITGVGVGYAIDEHWVPNLSANFSYPQLRGSAKSTLSWSIRPGLNYVFAAGESVRPFAGASVDIGKSELVDGYQLGARLRFGSQLHVAPHFSIDPFVELAYEYSHVSGNADAGFSTQRASAHDVSIQAGFALSAWL
jgi:hypothetical protein